MVKRVHGSIHHIRPISRGGKKTPDNELEIGANLHEAWHTLFGNLLVDEVITLIEKLWLDKSGNIQKKYLVGELIKTKRDREKDKRISAWETIFGNTRSADDAVRIIQDKFTKRT